MNQVRVLRSWCVCLLLLGSLPGLKGQSSGSTEISLMPAFMEEGQLAQNLSTTWLWDAMESSVEAGLLGIAANFVEALKEVPLDEQRVQRLYNIQLYIALLSGDAAEASRLVRMSEERGFNLDVVLVGLMEYASGNLEKAGRLLDQARLDSSSIINDGWLKLLQALIDYENKSLERSEAGFLSAIEEATRSFDREHFELIRFRQNLRSGAVSPEEISALRESVRSMAGQRGGFEAARLLAIALSQQGNATAAVEVLGRHLAMPGIREFGLRSDFLLLAAIIAGPDSARGRLALEQLIGESNDLNNLDIAFSLFSAALLRSNDIDVFLETLNGWLGSAAGHPLSDRMLLEKAYLLIQRGELTEAGQSAEKLIQLFPDSPHRASALRVLAQVAWREDPPAYRTAADYLNQLRAIVTTKASADRTSILMADCFFLNRDFRRAAEVYEALALDPLSAFQNQANYQRILAEIGSNRLDAAAAILNLGYEQRAFDAESLWRAEWNLVDAFRKSGRITVALERVANVLGRAGEWNVQSELRLRMEWLRARLNVESGNYEEALARADETLDTIGELDLSSDLSAALISHLLLVAGEASYYLGGFEEGGDYFDRLRSDFPESGPSILSYLIESRLESAEDNLVSAQQSLIALVDQFPESEFAPVALWEAALNAQQRGLPSNFQEAISILERLITDYPEHGLVYYARLQQGDLARLLNDFPTALSLYEDCLRQFPNHPEVYRCELSRADCLMAMGGVDPIRYDAASAIFERIFMTRDAPYAIRMESGFKWANALSEMGDRDGRERALWMLCEKYCFNDAQLADNPEPIGNYWLSRSFLALAELQTEEGRLASSVLLYNTIIRLGLPGKALASSRLNALR